LKNRFAALVFHFDKNNEEEILNTRKSVFTKNKIGKLSRKMKSYDLRKKRDNTSDKFNIMRKNKISRSFHASSFIKSF